MVQPPIIIINRKQQQGTTTEKARKIKKAIITILRGTFSHPQFRDLSKVLDDHLKVFNTKNPTLLQIVRHLAQSQELLLLALDDTMLCADFFVPRSEHIHSNIGNVLRLFETQKEELIDIAIEILNEATTIDKNMSLWHLEEDDQKFINMLIQLKMKAKYVTINNRSYND